MALGADYCTVAELKTQAQVSDTLDDRELGQVVSAVSRMVERYCHRQFNDAESATARVFYPDTSSMVTVDDFSTTTGLVVKSDTALDGTYATTISSSYYDVLPLNGVVGGQTGHPYRCIQLHLGSGGFEMHTRPTVEVTARWGWAAVPADVKRAALIQAARVFRRKHAPDGVLGFGDFVVRVPNRLDPDVQHMLDPYRVVALVA